MTTEATGETLARQEQAALDALLKQIDGYKDTKAGKIYGTLARRIQAEPGHIIRMGDKLVLNGLFLLHSSLQAGDNRFPFRQVGNTHVLDLHPDSGIVDNEFVGEIDDALKKSHEIISKRGKGALQAVSRIYPLWANKSFGVEYDRDFAGTMFESPAVVTVWDHKRPERKLFGDIWGIPEATHTPTFNYWKMTEVPIHFSLSDEYANDSKQYVTDVARKRGGSRQEVLNLSVAHERVHPYVTQPIVDLVVPNFNNWWSEAVAITYSDLPNYQNRQAGSNHGNQTLDVKQLMTAESGVDYEGSLSLWLGLSSMEAGSFDPEKIYQGSDGLVEKMVGLAEKGTTIQPWEIPSRLFPEIEESSVLSEANARRPIMLGMLSQGAFAA